MRISSRLHMSTLFSTLTVFIAGAAILFTFDQVNEMSKEGTQADTIVQGVFELNILTNDYLLHHAKRPQIQWRLKHDSLTRHLSALKFRQPDKQSLLSNLTENHKDMQSLFSRLVSNYEKQIPDRNEPVHRQLEARIASQLMVKSQKMISDAFKLVRKSRKELIAVQKKTDLFIMILFAILSAIIGANSFLIGRSIVKPIAKLHSGTEEIGKGNLDYKLSTEARDEIGQLARAFDEMTRNLRAVTSSRDELNKEIAERKGVEEELKRHRDHLEELVKERTAQLESVNKGLRSEIIERKRGEVRLQEQFIRMNLLNQITRATAERQDLNSIFQVVLQHLEKQLPIDFGCMCFYDAISDTLIVKAIGSKSQTIAIRMGLEKATVVSVGQNGLRTCVQGQTAYEPDIDQVDAPMLKKMAQAGLHSLVAAPLMMEDKVLGTLLAARCQKAAFSSVDCEFLRQLSEHIALAAHQAQLYEDLHKAYEELRETQQAVMEQERLRSMGQMASGLAHDINNALGPITLYTESLLEGEPDLSERAKRYLKTIQTAAEDIASTVARLREFYRKREKQLDLLPVSLNPLVKQVIELTRPRWEAIPQERGIVIDIKTELQDDLPTINGIESEIREALTNLIFNGVDAMPDGGTLTIKTAVQAAGVILDVSDAGIGMDEDTKSRCLEPFFTTKGERGTGLGLAMVYGVMQRHEGEIEIEGKPSKGTKIGLVFPAKEPEQTTAYPTGITKPSQFRILCIDDDPLMRRSLQETLKSDGHEVQAAESGQAGLAAFFAAKERGQAFDIIITDLGMPHMDGRQVARKLKHASPNTPVILLTGWGTRINAEGEAHAHVDRVLSKPPKMGELRRTLAELTERHT